MSRAAWPARASLAGLVTVSALVAIPAGGAARTTAARLQVVEKEYSLTLSRLRVHTGRVTIQVVNFGMDDHDLVIQPTRGSASIWQSSLLAPEGIATKTFSLKPGRYTLSCSLPGHRQLGMVATLTVTG